MKRMKRMRTPLALVAAMALIVACGNGADDDNGIVDDDNGIMGDDNGDDEEAAAGAQEGDEITVWIMQPGSDEVEELLEGYTEEFQDETGSTVNLQFVPWAQAHDQFTTAIAAGETPDVAEMGTTWTAEFGDLGVFASQEAQIAEEDYVEAVVESGRLEGEALGLPWYAGARALLYRIDVFEDLGIDPPATWDEFMTAGETIQAETDLFPFALNTSVHQYMPMVWHAGGEIAEEVEPGQWEARINEPEGVEAFDFYASMLRDHDFAPSGALNWNAGDARAAFFNDEAAMLLGLGIDVSISEAENPDLEGNIGVAPNPEGPGGDNSPFAGGSHLVVFEDSDAPDTAQAYAEFLLEEERVSEFAEAVGFFPGTIDGIEAMDLDDNYQELANALTDARTYPPHPAWGGFEGEELFVNAIQEIMQGSDAQEVLDGVAERMDEAFAD